MLEPFFTKAFYLLQEVAGLAKLASLDVRYTPPKQVVRYYINPIPPNLSLRRENAGELNFSRRRVNAGGLTLANRKAHSRTLSQSGECD